ncbi:unnamed protein product [Polarella glacialis]|uniref:Uncharacterized protein n=1 Tax=Polarella glacialis TaxID=89957 RepID=A0A813KXZ1_POLGL|nr:unnamed protein product [Polarella glacialis]
MSSPSPFAWLWTPVDTDSKAIQQLKSDWLADNAASRPEDVTRKELEKNISLAEEAVEGLKDPTKLLDLAEAYGILSAKDKRCLDTCELMMQVAVPFLERKRQGDAHQLYGRCLFLVGRFADSLRALQRAKECYKEQGSSALRRVNNIGLLRAYAALGMWKEATKRLEVALTLCESKDDAIMIYTNSKNTLEGTGNARDAEMFDDIWFVHLDLNPETKALFENYNAMGENLMKNYAHKDEGPENWSDVIKENKGAVGLMILAIVAYFVIVYYIFIMFWPVLFPKVKSVMFPKSPT